MSLSKNIYKLLPKLLKKIVFILPKGDPIKLAVLFLLMLVAAGLEVAGIGMIPAFVSIIADPESVMSIEWLKPLLSFLNVQTARDLLVWGSVTLVAIFVIKSLYTVLYAYFESRFISHRRYLISRRLMAAYMQAPYTFHLERNTAELLRNITQEVNIVVGGVLMTLLTFSQEVLMTVSILLFLFYLEPLITLVVILFSGLGAGSFLFFTQQKVKTYGEQEQNHRKNMIKAVNQGIGGIKAARILNREEEFINKFCEEAYSSSRLIAYMDYIRRIPKPIVETTAVLTMMLISAIMVWQGRPMSTIIPILTLFAMATVRLMPSVQKLSSMYTNIIYNIVAINPVYEDLSELNDNIKKFESDRNKRETLKLDNKIDAINIGYSYPGSRDQALCDVSFEIPKGKAIAFVGESGAGKTTLVDILLGLLTPKEGVIKVDGRDIQLSLSAWQKNIGYIPQSIYLADETIRNNIAFGIPEKEIDDKKVWQAIKSAQLEKLVRQLPNGLDTSIGEHGTRFSGGQRQRIGIARALYHNPQVLVMDEATSALDNATEKEITQAIESLKGEKTVIMIAHRLTTVKNCNMLYLMKNGKIIEKGSYDELIEKSKEFRQMALV